MARNVSQEGIDLIKFFEGFSPKACKCVSTEKYYTIGYGHYGADVKPNQTITREEAEELLKKDLQITVKHVNNYMAKYNFTQSQFDALVSFTYNVGSINQLTASGTRSISTISSKILLYNKSGGVVLNGLVKRRKAEKELFDRAQRKTNEEIAKEVINGKWGNGSERKKRLEAEGYDYSAIQKIVNKLLKG